MSRPPIAQRPSAGLVADAVVASADSPLHALRALVRYGLVKVTTENAVIHLRLFVFTLSVHAFLESFPVAVLTAADVDELRDASSAHPDLLSQANYAYPGQAVVPPAGSPSLATRSGGRFPTRVMSSSFKDQVRLWRRALLRAIGRLRKELKVHQEGATWSIETIRTLGWRCAPACASSWPGYPKENSDAD